MSLQLIVDPGVVQDYPGLAATLGISAFSTANGGSPLGHAFPVAGYFVVQNCGGALSFTNGPLTASQIAAIPACAVDTNAATLRTRAQAAFARRNAFRALAAPTNAQVIAEVKAMDADLNGLARLIFGDFTSTADS